MSNPTPTPDERPRAGANTPAAEPAEPGIAGSAGRPDGSGPGRQASQQVRPARGKGGKGADAGRTRAPKPYKSSDDWGVFRAVVIGVGVLVAGFGLYNLITGTAGLPDGSGGEVDPTLESQYRFFSAMMVGVGAAFVAIAVKFQWANMLWLVCLMVFLGGIGRVVSWAFSGTPHFTFIVLMIVELAFPPALLVWHRFIAKTSDLRRQYTGQNDGGAAEPGVAGGTR